MRRNSLSNASWHSNGHAILASRTVLRSVALVTQLSYQPALDPFHTVFRLMRLRDAVLVHGPLHEDHTKILDFFLLFPFRITTLRLKPAHRRFRRLAKLYSDLTPYGNHPEDRVLFDRMSHIQSVALDTLSTKRLIDPQQHRLGTVVYVPGSIPSALSDRIDQLHIEQEELIRLLTILALEYDLLGPDGLKGRSGLMEHRYDAI